MMLVGGLALAGAIAAPPQPLGAAADIVMYAADASTMRGNWFRTNDSTAAGGQRMGSSDNGWSATDNASSNPADYFELTFNASSNTRYRIWVRMRAGSNSKYNDSAYVQFSDALDGNGSSVYGIGTSSGLTLNLQSCNGCSLGGWGWMDGAYWLNQVSTVSFATSGTHTVRVQTREDGVSVDQIVLSPTTYLSNSPGQSTNDSTIVPKTTTSSAPSGGSGAFGGTPAAVPGTVSAANYDLGGEGVAYHDTSSGNSGGAFRSDSVDIESSSEGGYDVGWVSAGEWMNYSVNVASSGSYTAEFRVASPNGGQMHIGFNGGSAVWSSVSIPATGGWQDWTSVNVPVTLAAGQQVMTLMFDTGGINVRYVKLTSGGSSTPTPPPSTPPSTGATPYTGSPAAIPGTISAANFDNGGEGVAYHDTTSGNSGGALRSTNVDIESSSEGGYDVGWTSAGEWLNYTVSVASGGSYTAQLRVASVNGATMHLGFNGSSSVWTSVSIPSTGGWQSWATVNVPVTLGAGQQTMTVAFDTGGVNIGYVKLVAGSAPAAPPPSGGTSVVIADWNIQVSDSTGHAQTVIDTLMALNPRPQIIILQEAYKSLYNTYVDRLNSVTGMSWSGVFKTHCPPGAWNGSSCTGQEEEGVAIFSSLPVSDTLGIHLPYSDCYHSARALAHATVSVNGVPLHVFGTHLQTGGCGNEQQARYNSMSMIKSFAANYSGAWVVGGDFNADPDQIDTNQGMTPTFVDSWYVAGSGTSLTAFNPSWSMKIDYLFTDANGKATTDWTSVVTSTGSVSDHRAVMGSFRIRP
jgi:endonuclease/exonuclease/phosphatase family metal-dependent hydrolase